VQVSSAALEHCQCSKKLEPRQPILASATSEGKKKKKKVLEGAHQTVNRREAPAVSAWSDGLPLAQPLAQPCRSAGRAQRPPSQALSRAPGRPARARQPLIQAIPRARRPRPVRERRARRGPRLSYGGGYRGEHRNGDDGYGRRRPDDRLPQAFGRRGTSTEPICSVAARAAAWLSSYACL